LEALDSADLTSGTSFATRQTVLQHLITPPMSKQAYRRIGVIADLLATNLIKVDYSLSVVRLYVQGRDTLTLFPP